MGIAIGIVAALATIACVVVGILQLRRMRKAQSAQADPPVVVPPPAREPVKATEGFEPSFVREGLPPIWNVPQRRNPNFTGREDLLRRLREALTRGTTAAVTQTEAVHGMGGVGKTELAKEYVYRYAGEYEIVWWVRSEEAATLAADFAALAVPFGLPEKDAAKQPQTIDAVLAWLRQNGGWLIVFDNVHEPGDLRGYLPQGPGHVIITTRNPNWRGTAEPLAVETWPRGESVAFLRKRTQREGEDEAAHRLAEALGDLPLALEQAGAFIAETGESIAGYLKLLRDREAELLARGSGGTGYEFTVATTWGVSLERVRRTKRATDLLKLCAFLAPDDIPLEVIREGAGELPRGFRKVAKDKLLFDEAVGALKGYSLVKREGDALSVHRLVQAVVRNGMTAEERKTWAAAAAEVMNGAFPDDSDDVRTWAVCSRLLPHAEVAAVEAERSGIAPEAAARLLHQAGLYLRGRAEFAQAKACFERALGIDEKAYGPDHPEVATDVNNLGKVLQNLGDFAAAKACFERALRVDEKAYGPDHPEVATDVNDLGGALRDLGHLAEAKMCFERALAAYEKALGPDHAHVAAAVNNLGGVLEDMGDLAEAKACYERALGIWEKAFGPDHPHVATAVNNLGGVLQAMGDLAGAKAWLERALRIDEKAYGPEHPEVATDVNRLGSVLYQMGDLKRARDCVARALAIRRKFLGEEHLDTVQSRENLQIVEEEIREAGLGRRA